MDFAAHGASIVLTGRNIANLNKTAERCKEVGATDDKVYYNQLL